MLSDFYCFYWHRSATFYKTISIKWFEFVSCQFHANNCGVQIANAISGKMIAAAAMMSSQGRVFTVSFGRCQNVQPVWNKVTEYKRVIARRAHKSGRQLMQLILSDLQLSIHLSTRQQSLINVQIEFMHLILRPSSCLAHLKWIEIKRKHSIASHTTELFTVTARTLRAGVCNVRLDFQAFIFSNFVVWTFIRVIPLNEHTAESRRVR